MIIGFDATSLGEQLTGIENYALRLIQTLPRVDRKNQYVVFARTGYISAASSRERVRIVKCIGGRLFAQHVPLALAVSRSSLTCVHFPAFPPPPTINKPTVVTIHDAVVWKHPETVPLHSRIYFDMLYRLAARRATVIVTVSESSKRDIVSTLSLREEKVHVVYPGIGQHFGPVSESSKLEETNRRYGLPDAFILFVGTLEPRKNLPTLIESFKKLRARIQKKDMWLVIAGRAGWGKRQVNRAIGSCGVSDRIKTLDYVPSSELICLYNLAAAFVYPSVYEGFGSPPLEAMACGTPTVVSNVPPFPELTRGAAVLADPRSVQDLTRSLETVCFDEALRRRLSEEGPNVAGLYTWENTAAGLVKVYNTTFS